MVQVGQAVVHRHAAEAGQDLDVLLGVAAELDGVVQPAQHPRGVLHRLFVTDLRPRWTQVGDISALVVGCHFKGAARARGRAAAEARRKNGLLHRRRTHSRFQNRRHDQEWPPWVAVRHVDRKRYTGTYCLSTPDQEPHPPLRTRHRRNGGKRAPTRLPFREDPSAGRGTRVPPRGRARGSRPPGRAGRRTSSRGARS